MCLVVWLSFLQIYVFFCPVNCMRLSTYMFVMDTNPNFKNFIKLMEGPVGARVFPPLYQLLFPLFLGCHLRLRVRLFNPINM